MKKTTFAGKLMLYGIAAGAIYLTIVLILTAVQANYKVGAPEGAASIFYFPKDKVIVSGISLIAMAVFAIHLVPREKAHAKLGVYPLVGMPLLGLAMPIAFELAERWEFSTFSGENVTMGYMFSANYVQQKLEWIMPFFFISLILFAAGMAIAYNGERK